MEAIEINTTLAGVEGINYTDWFCRDCGETMLISDDRMCSKTYRHHDLFKNSLTDYTTSLDPCMRVAVILGFEIRLTESRVGIYRFDGHLYNAKLVQQCRVFGDATIALTLSTMLAEIARERG